MRRKPIRIAADQDDVQQARRSIGGTTKSPAGLSSAKQNGDSMAKNLPITFDFFKTDTLRAIVADPACTRELKAEIEALIERNEAAGSEGEPIAASFGGRVPSDSFVRSCKATAAK